MTQPFSTLFTTLLDWMVSRGAEKLNEKPGLWKGETDEWIVEFNPHQDETNGLSPITARLSHQKLLAFAIVGPYGGAITGVNEDDIIAHFETRRLSS